MKKPIVLLAALCACTSYKKTLPAIAPATQAAKAPQVYTFSAKARQTRLSAIIFDLPMGYRYGEAAAGYNGMCSSRQPMVNTKGRFQFDVTKYSDVFNKVMKQHGYPVEEDLELFKDSKERVADLHVGARIIEATINECYPRSNDLQAVGSAYLKIEWSLYSVLEKKVIFTAVTEGSTYGDVESNIGEAGILRPALADAVERLSAHDEYRRAIDPPVAAAAVVRATRFRIKGAKAFSGDLKSNMEKIKKAVATVTANKGFGSGFVISEDGTVLTAEHVVSGSRFAKVTTASGKECYGEVVASSKPRDLALVKLDCTGLAALPLAHDKIDAGTEVFAIGTPLSEKLDFSVTRGVVSAMRKMDDFDYIQSDVTVLPGNSGGPLLDSRGNAIGVATVAASVRSVPVGLNFFVPVADLEKYLPVDLE